MEIIDPQISEYVNQFTKPEPSLLHSLIKETHDKTNAPEMLTGRVEGRLLKFLVTMSGATQILEIGMFTGYSALCMAEGMPVEGKLITCEIDEKAKTIAEKYFKESPYGFKIEIRMGAALETIKTIVHHLDFVFIDADKENYLNYYKAVLPKVKSGGLIVFDNSLRDGEVLSPQTNSARVIHETNQFVLNDKSVENVLLTVRDGINIVRKL